MCISVSAKTLRLIILVFYPIVERKSISFVTWNVPRYDLKVAKLLSGKGSCLLLCNLLVLCCICMCFDEHSAA